jgi:hypothetical protein
MFAAIGLVLALSSATVAPDEAFDENVETAEIIGLLLRDRLAANGEGPDGNYLVVSAEFLVLCTPNDDEQYEYSLTADIGAPGVLPAVPESLRRALLCEPAGGMLPTDNFENAQVVLSSEIDAIFSGEGWWEDFYKTFPGSRGYVQFTAPAFSPDHQHALIYVSHSCGGLCGTGWLVYLARGESGWRIESRQMLWIS